MIVVSICGSVRIIEISKQNLKEFKLVKAFVGIHTKNIEPICYFPDGKIFASICRYENGLKIFEERNEVGWELVDEIGNDETDLQCKNAIMTSCQGLSQQNKKILEQKGAKFEDNAEELKDSNEKISEHKERSSSEEKKQESKEEEKKIEREDVPGKSNESFDDPARKNSQRDPNLLEKSAKINEVSQKIGEKRNVI